MAQDYQMPERDLRLQCAQLACGAMGGNAYRGDGDELLKLAERLYKFCMGRADRPPIEGQRIGGQRSEAA